MEKAKLIVKNFGPLKDIEVEVREMITFIGAQASGKSTLAKLLSIFDDYHFRANYGKFESELETYKINSYLNAKTYISYVNTEYSFEYKDFKDTKSNKRSLIRKELLDAVIDRDKIKINNLLLELIIFELKISKLSELKFSNEILDKINDQLEINITKKTISILICFSKLLKI
jgi:predicted ATPase